MKPILLTNILRASVILIPGLCIGAPVVPKENSHKRNVLIILSDDQGYAEMNAFSDLYTKESLGYKDAPEWRKRKNEHLDKCIQAASRCMPNIDALAERGIRFTQLHTSPVCGPSRAMLMTARYPQRFGVYGNLDMNEHGVPASEHFLAKEFQDAGYMTGVIGKWHLGHGEGQHPNDRGFDYWFGFDSAQTAKYDSDMLFLNRAKAQAEGWLADQFSSEAVDFLKRADEADKPFFLYLAYNEPHGPRPLPPQEYLDYFADIWPDEELTDRQHDVRWFSYIYGMDVGIGKVFDQLKAMGAEDNTLIVYCSDNGQAQGIPLPGNGPHRGTKRMILQGGISSPMIVHMPGMEGPMKTCTEIVSLLDFMPTALDYAGIDIAENTGGSLDGRSLLGLIEGTQVETPHQAGLFYACDVIGMALDAEHQVMWSPHLEMYNQRDQEFIAYVERFNKMTPQEREEQLGSTWRYWASPAGWYARQGEWKLMGIDRFPPLLFNMEKDAAERHDVAAQYPDVVKELRKGFANWVEGMPEPLEWNKDQWKMFLPEEESDNTKEE